MMFGERILLRAGRNPFYLLSALSMLLGCFALSRHLTLVPGQWIPLVILMGVLQIYEFLLLGLASYLHRRGPARADAASLFLLGLAFLVDVTYLNAELAAAHPWVAPWVALALLVLAAVKLLLLRDALGLTSRRALAVAIAELGLLLYLPGAISAFYYLDSKVYPMRWGPEVLPHILYGFWWLVGCIPIAFFWTERNPETALSPAARGIARAALMLPFASLLVHFLSLHLLYRLPFQAYYATPLLLGASTYASFTLGQRLAPFRAHFRWAAPAFAILFSTSGPDLLSLTWHDFDVVISPLRVALVGLALVWYLHGALAGERAFGWAAAGALLMALSGHAPSSMAKTWTSIVPETALELGVASIVAAFAFLALGFARSLVAPRTTGSSPGHRLVPSKE
jgi:hypothetical protein